MAHYYLNLSLLGCSVGTCWPSRSSFNMCRSVVLPALSRPRKTSFPDFLYRPGRNICVHQKWPTNSMGENQVLLNAWGWNTTNTITLTRVLYLSSVLRNWVLYTFTTLATFQKECFMVINYIAFLYDLRLFWLNPTPLPSTLPPFSQCCRKSQYLPKNCKTLLNPL